MSRGKPLRCAVLIASVALASFGGEIEKLYQPFVNPPDDCRIGMRWWWFGAAVENQELDRELQVMKAAGIGRVEIQPVYPLALDDPKADLHNIPYLSSEYLDRIRYVSKRARQLGILVDVTLGSGWPFGGPSTPVTQAAGRLRMVKVSVPARTASIPVPAMEAGEHLIAAFVDGIQGADTKDGRLVLPRGAQNVQFFIASRTGQQVKRAAVGAEGFVLDHYSRDAIQQHLSAVGDRLLSALGDYPPHSVFSDSLEVFGTDWTWDFLEQFKKRRGYDLLPHLPALFASGEDGAAANIRHDWAKTLTELAEDNYLTPIREWAHVHHTLFRSQTYGQPPVMLSSNRLVDLPEGEKGPAWRSFSAARWASSASHLYGRSIASSETWTWLHSPAFRATPLDLKAEADLHFVQGINQLIGHGWPYSPPGLAEPGWHFYAAAALNEHNPWFIAMPDITRYLQRVSFMMRQGEPANDVAIYLPTDDAWARSRPGHVSIDEQIDDLLGPDLIPAVLNAGFNFDFIDDVAIAQRGLQYKILLLPKLERMPAQTKSTIQRYKQAGGIVLDAGTNSDITAALRRLATPDFLVDRSVASSIGFNHRKLDGTDIYFVANTSNIPISTDAAVRTTYTSGQGWDAASGLRSGLPMTVDHPAGVVHVPLNLAPYESTVLIFCNACAMPITSSKELSRTVLANGWELHLESLDLHSIGGPQPWGEDAATRFFSGVGRYTTHFDAPALSSSQHLILNLGTGTVVNQGPSRNGMRARLEGPVREAAVVLVNGKRVGGIWKSPYEIDVTSFLRPGLNLLDVEVGNTAMNEMAKGALPSYQLLNLRYGVRFEEQDMDQVSPLPSGLTEPVTLIIRDDLQQQ